MKIEELLVWSIGIGVIAYVITRKPPEPPSECTIAGSTRCSPTYQDTIEKCVNGRWVTWEHCPAGCKYISPTKAECKPLPPPECYEGDTRCSSTNPNVMEKCVHGQWVGWTTCTWGCKELYPSHAVCKSSPGEPTCVDGATRCSPTNPLILQKCINGEWVDFQSCGLGCEETPFGAYCRSG